MKKSLIVALGGVAFACSSYGQGSIAFDTYNAQSFAGIITTYAVGPNAGTGINSTFTGLLLWSSTQINDTATSGPVTQGSLLTAGWNIGLTATFNTGNAAGVGGLGYIVSPDNLTIASAVGQSLWFEVVAFDGAGYALGTYSGHSAAFQATLVTGTTLPNANQLNNLQPFSVYNVTAVPEPSTLALAGLGGFGMLMALRRKKA